MSDNNPKGFSGLSHLHSKSEVQADLVESDFQSETPTDTITTSLSKSQSSSQHENTVDAGSESEATVGTLQDDQQQDNKSGVSWGYLVWPILIAGLFMMSMNQNNDTRPKGSVSKATTSTAIVNPTATNTQTSKAPPVGDSSTTSKSLKSKDTPKPSYHKPSIGSNNVLSVSQIRWCTRESIRIEAMRNVFDTNGGISEFNKIVNDYNARCGNYRYRRGDLTSAQSEVETHRAAITSEAVREAKV